MMHMTADTVEFDLNPVDPQSLILYFHFPKSHSLMNCVQNLVFRIFQFKKQGVQIRFFG